jgi:hypothetical protein
MDRFFMSFFFSLSRLHKVALSTQVEEREKRKKRIKSKEEDDENATRKLLYNEKKLLPQICSKHSTFLLPFQLGASPC